jgi:hypothetical protein
VPWRLRVKLGNHFLSKKTKETLAANSVRSFLAKICLNKKKIDEKVNLLIRRKKDVDYQKGCK